MLKEFSNLPGDLQNIGMFRFDYAGEFPAGDQERGAMHGVGVMPVGE